MAEVTRCVGKQVMNIFFTLSVCGESLHTAFQKILE